MKWLNKLELHHIALLGMFFTYASRVTLDADTWWHMCAGRWMVQHHQLLSVDVFSYTRYGEAWQAPGWLVQIGLYLLYDRFGPGGLNILTGLVMTLALWFIYRSLSGSELLKSSLLVLSGSVTVIHALARPALFTLLFTAISLNILEDYRWQRRNHLWLLPLIMVLWANIHGLFLLGVGLVGIYLTDSVSFREKRLVFDRHLAGVLPLLVGTACLNPYGSAILVYFFNAAAAQPRAAEFITEWQSPDFHLAQTLPFLILLLLILITLGFSQKRIARADGLLLLTFIGLALLSGRNIALAGLVVPIVLSRHAGELPWFAPVHRQPVSDRTQILAVTGFALLSLYGGYRLAAFLPAEANLAALEKQGMIPSKDAIAWIQKNQPTGHMLNSYNWGGYLQWALPESPVFVDGRADLYGDEIVLQWYAVTILSAKWQDVLADWNIQWVILEKDWPAAQALQLAGWQLDYQDDITFIYQKPIKEVNR